jgi:hypothetical protein
MRIPEIRAGRLQFLRGVEHGRSLRRRNPSELGLGLRM